MTMVRVRAAVVAVVVPFSLGLVGCLAAPPLSEDAQIACDTDDACPTGWRCSTALERCVLVGAEDGTAPLLVGDAVLSAARVAPGDDVRLTFAVSEALAVDPTVVVAGGAFALDETATDRDALAYAFAYVASGFEPEDEPQPIAIALVDRSLNEGLAPGGVVVFDRTPPGLLGTPTLSHGPLSQLDDLTVSFSVTEALAAAPRVRLGEHELGEAAATGDESWTLASPLAALTLESGTLEARVTLVDTAGLVSDVPLGAVIIDVTAPATLDLQLTRIPASGPAVVLGVGHELVVTFRTDEPVRADDDVDDLVVSARCGGVQAQSVALTRDPDPPSSTFFVHRLTLAAGALPDGPCGLVLVVTDLAGNVTEDTVNDVFTVDTTPPLPIDVATPDLVVYARVPWGADAFGGARRFTVTGAAGAVEPDARVAVYEDGQADGGASAVRVASAGSDGSFSVVLNPVDRASVFVTQLDAAGNESPPVRVRDVAWTASLGGKVPGRFLENPHRGEARFRFEEAKLSSRAAFELSDAVARSDGVSAQVRGGASFQRLDAARVTDREQHAATYDPVRGEVVLFGGASCACGGIFLKECPDLMRRDDDRWSVRTVNDPDGDGSPSARTGSSLVFDASRGAALLFGGRQGGTLLSETWELDDASFRRACTTGCTPPPARADHGSAYDPTRKRIVVFGGQGAAAALDDTWEWDARAQAWVEVCGVGCTRPPARTGHALTFDADSGAVVMFGGQGAAGPLNDLWAWDGTTWVELCTSDDCRRTRPPARTEGAFAGDPRAGTLVLFGGVSTAPSNCDDGGNESEQVLADTWVFRDGRWSQQVGAGPSGRAHAALIDHGGRRRLLLTGGAEATPCATVGCARGRTDDEWEWDGEAWHAVTVPSPGAAPSGAGVAAVSDPGLGHVTLIGSTTHTFSGVFRVGTAVRQHVGAAPLSDAILIFGGLDGSNPSSATQRLRGSTLSNACNAAFPILCSPPPARIAGRLAENPRGGVVLFGGRTSTEFDAAGFGDTWVFDGTRWGQRTCVGERCAPDARGEHSLVFDAARGRVVLFGGNVEDLGFGQNGETWEWDGTAWAQRNVSGPEPRQRHAALYDPDAERTIVSFGRTGGFFGAVCGDSGSILCDDHWEWDGEQWRELTVVDPEGDGEPRPRADHTMAWTDATGTGLLAGGLDAAGSALNDAWLFHGGGGTRPALLTFFTFAAAGAEDATVLAVDVNARAVGRGAAGAGATLWLWAADHFVEVATSVGGSEVLQWQSEDDVDLGARVDSLIFGRADELIVAVTPSGPGGAGRGEISLDGLEATIRYRLP